MFYNYLYKKAETATIPSYWKPGKMTYNPQPDIIGNLWKVWKTKTGFD
jgi:hypothetical protein